MTRSDLEVDCDPLVTNESLLLNPCGLIANSLFNGMFDICVYMICKRTLSLITHFPLRRCFVCTCTVCRCDQCR